MGKGQLWLALSLYVYITAFGLVHPKPPPTPYTMDATLALKMIDDVATTSVTQMCSSEAFRSIPVPVRTDRFDNTRQNVDMAARVFQQLGASHHNGGLADALCQGLILSNTRVLQARVLTVNTSSDELTAWSAWRRTVSDVSGPERNPSKPPLGQSLDPSLPWIQKPGTSTSSTSPKFMKSLPYDTYRGWWTFPYYSCDAVKWIISYTVSVPPSHSLWSYVSVDVDISDLDVNQCDTVNSPHDIEALHGTHKCHNLTTKCVKSRSAHGWQRGGYVCNCRPGFYSLTRNPHGAFNGSLVEAAFSAMGSNTSDEYEMSFSCVPCAPGCHTCLDSSPCLAYYNWPFRITLLVISLTCVALTLCLVLYVYQHHRLKVFRVASPIFLAITLLGCSIMYLEMAAIFPVLDIYSCIVTKWTRHLGFCITYTALLMKTWRVSLTYRVKSAHKVKLTDKQLLQWMFPILLVMVIYLGAWSFSDPPTAIDLKDPSGHKFKQCTFNWWDHAIAIGEVLFLAWGVRVCYNVRNAESFYNEAHLISYAIYNIAIVNIAMVAFHILLFPDAGPDIKYLLGFIRTQLSTSVTIMLVFGPKVARVLRGEGDQWDNRARARGVTASFSLNGVGLVHEETADLYHENEELKEEIQKLAGQIQFMRIVHMETNNRHLRPRPGSYFQSIPAGVVKIQGKVEEDESAARRPGVVDHLTCD